jgi:tripartite-type tricarboxylate transporter receptor subunit TctC
VRFPLVIGASASVRAKDLRGFLDEARKQPAKFSYASTGVGSMNHLVMEDIKRKAGVYVLHVPYGGGGPAVQAVLGDVSQLTLLSYAALKGQIAGRQDQAAGGHRSEAPARNCRTCRRWRSPAFPASRRTPWIGIFAPAATPARHAAQAHRGLPRHADTPEVHGKLTQGRLRGDGHRRPGVERHTKQEYERWGAFVRTTG